MSRAPYRTRKPKSRVGWVDIAWNKQPKFDEEATRKLTTVLISREKLSEESVTKLLRNFESLCADFVEIQSSESERPTPSDSIQGIRGLSKLDTKDFIEQVRTLDFDSRDLLCSQAYILSHQDPSCRTLDQAELRMASAFDFREKVVNSVLNQLSKLTGRPTDYASRNLAVGVAQALKSVGIFPTKSIKKQSGGTGISGKSDGSGTFARILTILFNFLEPGQKSLGPLVRYAVDKIQSA